MDDEERWIVRCMESRRIVGGIGVIREQVSFFVHPHLQGQGYGRAALAALQRLRQARGAWPRLSAWTIRENSAARRAFEAATRLELGTRRQHRGQPTLVHYRSPLI